MSRLQKPDRRVERSKNALREALIALLSEQGYEATTVQDLLERANVGRATFYAHFGSKDALLESLLDTLDAVLRAHREELRAAGRTDTLLYCTAMFEHAHQHRALYRGIVGRRGGSTVLNGIRARIALLVREELAAERTAARADALPLDIVVEHVVAGFSAVLSWWLNHRTSYGPREIDDAFRRLTLAGLRSVI
jgi:AcrR family transcriptional regulator